MNAALWIDQDERNFIATAKRPSGLADGLSEFLAGRRAVPKPRDGGLGLARADAGALALLHLGMLRRPRRALASLPFDVCASNRRKAKLPLKIAGGGLVLPKIVAVGNHPTPRQVNPRPNHMPVLAPVLHMRHDGAGLAGEAKSRLKPVDCPRPLLVGQNLADARIDRRVIERLTRGGAFGGGFHLAQSVAQIVGHDAAQLFHVDAFILAALNMGGDTTCAARRSALDDHGSRPSARIRASCISIR